MDGSGRKAGDARENLGRSLLPVGRLGLLVVGRDEILDRVNQRADIGVAATLDLPLREQTKPAFDLIEPGGVGGREMEVVTWALEQPALDQLGFVGGVVVEHQVDFKVRRDGALDKIEKLPKLLTAMSGKALAADLAGGEVQGRKKAGRAVAKVIRRAPFELAGLQGQNGLGAAQSLDLTLLVHAEHQGIDRRAQIKAHDVAHLLDKLRILGEDDRSRCGGA